MSARSGSCLGLGVWLGLGLGLELRVRLGFGLGVGLVFGAELLGERGGVRHPNPNPNPSPNLGEAGRVAAP